MCRAQRFTCIISLNPHRDARGEIQLLSCVAYKEPEEGYSKLVGEHTVRTWWSQDLNLSNLTPRFTGTHCFLSTEFQHSLVESPYQALPYLTGSDQMEYIQGTEDIRA